MPAWTVDTVEKPHTLNAACEARAGIASETKFAEPCQEDMVSCIYIYSLFRLRSYCRNDHARG